MQHAPGSVGLAEAACEAECPNDDGSDKARHQWSVTDVENPLLTWQINSPPLHTDKDNVKYKTKVSPFVSLAEIFDKTVDDVHECMSIWTPNIDSEKHDASGNYNNQENSCLDLFAATQSKSPGHGKWADLDCNQRTRAAVCTNYGNHNICLLYTSDAADDTPCVDLGGRRIIKNINCK